MLNEKNEKELEQINSERETIVDQYEVRISVDGNGQGLALLCAFSLRK